MSKEETMDEMFEEEEEEEEEEELTEKERIVNVLEYFMENKDVNQLMVNILDRELIIREDGDIFHKIVDYIYNSPKYYQLISGDFSILLPDDGDIFYAVANKMIDNEESLYELFDFFNDDEYKKYLKEEKTEKLYDRLVEIHNSDPGNAYDFLKCSKLNKNPITCDEGEIVLSAIKNEMYAFDILKSNIITKEHGDLFTQTVNAVKKPQLRANLIKCGIIPEE